MTNFEVPFEVNKVHFNWKQMPSGVLDHIPPPNAYKFTTVGGERALLPASTQFRASSQAAGALSDQLHSLVQWIRHTPLKMVYQAGELGRLNRIMGDLSPPYQLSIHRWFDTNGNCFQLAFLACNGQLGQFLADF